MTGLEKILSKIESDSDVRCREIADNAKAQADKIISDAQAQADSVLEQKKAETMRKAENMNQSAVSSAELAKSRIILKEKLEIIDDTLSKALDIIKALPKKEYFEILKELVAKSVRQGEQGVIRFSSDDTEKLPSNFIDSLNNSFKKSTGIKLGKSADIDSGFILVYGDIDINCSFDAIVASKRDELRDSLNELLFK